MTEDQFKKAKGLQEERYKLSRELDIWERELTAPSKLAYLQGWNNNHAVSLETQIPREVFDGFRLGAMNALQLRIVGIDAEFDAL